MLKKLLLRVVGGDSPDSLTAYAINTRRRVRMTNVTDLRRQWSPVCFFHTALVRTMVINRRIDRRCLYHTEEKLNIFRFEVDTAAAASVRRSCQLQVLIGVPDLERRGRSPVFFGGG